MQPFAGEIINGQSQGLTNMPEEKKYDVKKCKTCQINDRRHGSAFCKGCAKKHLSN